MGRCRLEGWRMFAPQTDQKGGSKERRIFEKGDRGGHGLKTGRKAIKEPRPRDFFSSSRRPGRPWSPPSLLHNGNRCSLPGVKRPRLETTLQRRVYEWVELPVYTFMAQTGANFIFFFWHVHIRTNLSEDVHGFPQPKNQAITATLHIVPNLLFAIIGSCDVI